LPPSFYILFAQSLLDFGTNFRFHIADTMKPQLHHIFVHTWNQDRLCARVIHDFKKGKTMKKILTVLCVFLLSANFAFTALADDLAPNDVSIEGEWVVWDEVQIPDSIPSGSNAQDMDNDVEGTRAYVGYGRLYGNSSTRSCYAVTATYAGNAYYLAAHLRLQQSDGADYETSSEKYNASYVATATMTSRTSSCDFNGAHYIENRQGEQAEYHTTYMSF